MKNKNCNSREKRLIRIFFLSIIYVFIAGHVYSEFKYNSELQFAPPKLYACTPYNTKNIILTWTIDSNTRFDTKFNIWRKLPGENNFQKIKSDITRIKSRDSFKGYIPVNSKLWVSLDSSITKFIRLNQIPILYTDPSDITVDVFWNFKFLYDIYIRYFLVEPYQVGTILGQLFMDNVGPNINGICIYKIEQIIGNTTLSDTISVTPGLPSIPENVNVTGKVGDEKIDLSWDREFNGNPFNSTYRIFRSDSPNGNYIPVSNLIYSYLGHQDDSVTNYEYKYTFFEDVIYNDIGGIIKREIEASYKNDYCIDNNSYYSFPEPLPIEPVKNGNTYYYRVGLYDLAHNFKMGNIVSLTPVDSTPPIVPVNISVNRDEENNKINISFTQYFVDVNNRYDILSESNFKIYRSLIYDDSTGGTEVTGYTTNSQEIRKEFIPAKDSLFFRKIRRFDNLSTGVCLNVSISDNNSQSNQLRGNDKDLIFYYRIISVDMNGNRSSLSVPVSGFLAHKKAPQQPVINLITGYENRIDIRYQLSNDLDIYEYRIFRAKCDRNQWFKDCSNPFILIATIPDSVAKLNNVFPDSTVPPKSPICYAYIVKAVDKSGNVSGANIYYKPNPAECLKLRDENIPIPTFDSLSMEAACGHLQDRTPPPAAIISGLKARSNSIIVDFIGQPIQDIWFYKILRSDDSEDGPYDTLVYFVVQPQCGGQEGVVRVRPVCDYSNECAVIPLGISDKMTSCTFTDTDNIKQKVTYWYKVTAVDIAGNEENINTAIPVSTFTYSLNNAKAPVFESIFPCYEPRTIRIRFRGKETDDKGYIIFRSTNKSGPYFQIGNLIPTDQFYDDKEIFPGQMYYYKVAILKKDGTLSELTAPQPGQCDTGNY
jgi:hypothetical protein